MNRFPPHTGTGKELVALVPTLNAADGLGRTLAALAGQVDFPLVGLVLTGGAVGGLMGVRVAKALAGRVALARKGFAAMIVAVAGFVGWNAVLGILATS